MLASRSLTRCVITLETSLAAAEQRIDAAAERIEAHFDELEALGHVFVRPRSKQFKRPQLGVDRRGGETSTVELLCAPPLGAETLRATVQRVAVLVSELPDVTPRELHAVDRVASEADTDPGEPKHESETREHQAQTRPEGVRRRRPVPQTAPDEVTDPQARDEVPTRPQDVFAIRRRG